MSVFRIESVYTEDEQEKIVMDVSMDSHGIIIEREYFGYVLEDNMKYPCILKPNNLLVFNDEYSNERWNLIGKRLTIGEFFTRWMDESDSYTYKITRIVEL